MPTVGRILITAVGANGTKSVTRGRKQTPFLQWKVVGNVSGRGTDGLVTIEEGATMLGEGTAPSWDEPLPDVVVPADVLLRAHASGARASTVGATLRIELEVRNHTMRRDKLIGTASIDALALVARVGNNNKRTVDVPLDTGGSVTLTVEFRDFPIHDTRSTTLRGSRSSAGGGASASASQRVDERRVSAAGRVLLRRHIAKNTTAAAAQQQASAGAGSGANASAGVDGSAGDGGMGQKATVYTVWTPRRDQHGALYYYCDVTGETAWEVPAGAYVGPSADEDLPGDWQERTDTQGRVYYYSPSAGVSQWDPPTTPATVPAPLSAPSRRSSVSAAVLASARRRKSVGGVGAHRVGNDGLPFDWVPLTDPSTGNTYYQSACRNVSQWEIPH